MQANQLKLGVNIDHVATVRQARRTVYPDVVEAALACEAAGAHGITAHLREDRRHIQDADIYALRQRIGTRLNLEMAVAPEIVRIACDVRPHEACLVPERRAELTTEGGLDVAGNLSAVGEATRALAAAGIVVSLFIDPEPRQLDAAKELGAPVVELHTGTYCDTTGAAAARELDRLVRAAHHGHQLGLHINAGHGINLANVAGILEIPHLDTLNIGHSIVAHAVMVGINRATTTMLAAMAAYRGGRSTLQPLEKLP